MIVTNKYIDPLFCKKIFQPGGCYFQVWTPQSSQEQQWMPWVPPTAYTYSSEET